ncbi:hypothetical protein GS458_3076 [Geobacillus stearothermophilus]|nr:hypothetical protein GS458_3076 [Geobacillus stearothermophilus]
MLKILPNDRHQEQAMFAGFLDNRWPLNERARPRLSGSCPLLPYRVAAPSRSRRCAALSPPERLSARANDSWL